MKQLRIIFMGTPDFSVPTLEALVHSEHQVVGVFCQPDKAKGRGQKVSMPPVKEVALQYNLPIYQPTTLKDDEVRRTIEELQPDIMIVIAYGKILPSWMLTLPPYGCINLHASILPKYRGAAPIQWAILEGEQETGVTVMQMDEGMDTGDILATIRTEILPEETAGELFDRLSLLGADHIISLLEDLTEGRLEAIPQNTEQATYTSKITKEMGTIDWNQPSARIDQQIRGLAPWPGAYSFLQDKRIRIWKAQPVVLEGDSADSSAEPGTVTRIEKNDLWIRTGDGFLKILELQPDNKKRMLVGDFIRGTQVVLGNQFHG